jgi:putative transcriptional regulator
MTITHHLDDATLMSFAAGALPAALAAVAAAHADMCPRCRREIAAMERLGGAVMADLSPVAFARPEPAPPMPVPAGARDLSPPRAAAIPEAEIPRPVERLLSGGLDAVAWRWLGPGVWDHPLPLTGAGKLRLLKVAPGHRIPEHGHGGAELTLVLRGAFQDETGRYAHGDVADLDETVEHQPVVTDASGECICLVGSETPELFDSLIARQWQRLRRF